MYRWPQELFCIMVWLRKYSRWVLGGFLLGIGFVISWLWPLGLVGVAGVVYLLQQDIPVKEKLLGAWLAWSIKAAFSVGWMWSTYPIEWLPAELGKIQILLIFATWFMTAISLGAGVFFLVLAREVVKRCLELPPWSYYLLLYPLLWMGSEVFGSVLFSIYSFGVGGSINAAFSYGYVGYLLAQHEWFLQLARIAGVYGLSAVTVFLVGVMFLMQNVGILFSRKLLIVTVVGLYLLSFIPLAHIVHTPVVDGYTVFLVDTIFGSRLASSEQGQREIRLQLEEAVAVALEKSPDYILLPEDSRYFNQLQPASFTKNLFQIKFNNPEVILIDSGRTKQGEKTVLQSFTYDGKGDTVERFHKRYLVPQGEYVMWIYEKAFTIFGFSDFLDFYMKGISYQVGPWTGQNSLSVYTPGILFCFESVDPQGVKTLTKERPNMPFVAHIASYAWFHDPYTLWLQTETMLQVQAVWGQQYIVSVGNMMPGNVYSPSGKVIKPELVEAGERWEIKKTTIPVRVTAQ